MLEEIWEKTFPGCSKILGSFVMFRLPRKIINIEKK